MNHFYQNIEGFMGYKNTAMLDIAISKMPSSCTWVEVGAWTGKSVAYTAVELVNQNKFGKFYAVDTWDGGNELQEYEIVKNKSLKEVFFKNIEPLKNMIQTIE